MKISRQSLQIELFQFNSSFEVSLGGVSRDEVQPLLNCPAVLLGLALLFGALVLIFLPFIQQEIAKYRPVVPTAPPKDELVEPVSKAGPPIGESTLVGTSAASSTASELAPQPAAQGFTTAAGEPSGALPSAVPAEAGSYPTLVFSAKKESRVMVTDARGAVVLSRTLIAGERSEERR